MIISEELNSILNRYKVEGGKRVKDLQERERGRHCSSGNEKQSKKEREKGKGGEKRQHKKRNFDRIFSVNSSWLLAGSCGVLFCAALCFAGRDVFRGARE